MEASLARAREHGMDGAFIFDLDSTVFDNRPRQARILREYGEAHGLPKLRACEAWHFEDGWDITAPIEFFGYSKEDREKHKKTLWPFWEERFFTSEYCKEDVEVLGAPAFVRKVADFGTRIIYLTGRMELMRPGTEARLVERGFPAPDGHGVHLWMKPTKEEDDIAFKVGLHPRAPAVGEVLGVFENEPRHVNAFLRSFPKSTVFHVVSDYSGHPEPVDEKAVSIPHFAW